MGSGREKTCWGNSQAAAHAIPTLKMLILAPELLLPLEEKVSNEPS